MANVVSSTLVLIGWDDNLCRPIYRRRTSKTKPTKKRSTKQPTTQLKCKGATSSGFSSSALLNHPPAMKQFKIEGRQSVSRNKAVDDHKRNANAEDDKAASKSRSCETREISIHPAPKKGHGSPASNTAFDFPTDSMSKVDDVDDVSRDENPTVAFNDTITSFERETKPHDYSSNSRNLNFDNDKVRRSVKSEATSITNAQIAVDTKNNDSIAAGAPNVNSQSTQCIVCPLVNSSHSDGLVDFGTSNRYANNTTNVSEEQGRANSNRTKVEDHCDPPNSRLSSQVLSSPLKEPTASMIFGYTTCREVESEVWIGCKTSPMIVREEPEDEVSISMEFQELQSPMLLECDRRNAESFDIETVDISFFGDLEPDEISLRDNRRSYGRSNKPNWVSKSSTARKSNECTAELPQLVGWDDVKCRPIYHVFKPKPSRKKVESSPDEVTRTSCLDEQAKDKNRPQKKRVYASTFRKSGIFKAARHDMDLDLPSSPVARRVTMESEVEDGEANRFFEASNNQVDELEFDSIFDLESNHSHCNQDKSFGETENSPRSESNIENRTQPTSKSTIKAARAFFRYTRRIRHCNQLRDEYNEYSKVADATGIDPISIGEFARHWNFYFTERGIIRDGLLDED